MWIVIEDKQRLDGADVHAAKEMFKEWIYSDQGALSEVSPQEVHMAWRQSAFGVSPRYEFFAHVDADALDSVVNKAPHPLELDDVGWGYVNLVYPWQEVEGNVPEEPGEEDMENYEYEDESWMMVKASDLIPNFYARFTCSELWYIGRQSPPDVCCCW